MRPSVDNGEVASTFAAFDSQIWHRHSMRNVNGSQFS